jgi:hypothetical protein
MNRLLLGFSILSLFSLGACVQMADAGPFCELTPLPTVQKEQNSAWCWAASVTLVINHLNPQRAFKQCTVVQKTIAPGRKDIDCCLVTDEAIGTADERDPKVIKSLDRCQTTQWPEQGLKANGYNFDLINYFPFEPGTDPYNQGLEWADLTRSNL